MKNIFKWTFRFAITGVVLLGFLIGIVLHPSLVYANKTEFGSSTVYHNKPLDKNLQFKIDSSLQILKRSEFYDPNIKFDICMNDGSLYPSLLELFLGKAFALGFTSNKVAICGELNCKENYVEVHGRRWNFLQLLAHEETHCLVFNKLGFWKSNPVANNPIWKWEGYPEYISRSDSSQTDLVKNIDLLNEAIKLNNDTWGISFDDNTVSSREYFNYRLLIQYCLEVKKMSFESLLKDTTSEQSIKNDMMDWYTKQKNNLN